MEGSTLHWLARKDASDFLYKTKFDLTTKEQRQQMLLLLCSWLQ
uniref:Uncharacterized protein n=1 Tax=Arundo donax TaxID=35708 RepID=A0A0A9AVH6_ARUDO